MKGEIILRDKLNKPLRVGDKIAFAYGTSVDIYHGTIDRMTAKTLFVGMYRVIPANAMKLPSDYQLTWNMD